MPDNIIGWDVGGAHLKAAVIDQQGHILKVVQQPCHLWKGLAELEYAVNGILEKIAIECDFHALTMTGELVDFFDNREHGVKQIINLMADRLGEDKVSVFAGMQGFIKPQQLTEQNWERIASANWLASVCYAAQKVQSALFIDIGSTTTDILVICDGQVKAKGITDFQRLCSGELVYTGIIRTPVMSLSGQVNFEGQQVALMAEYFATMADVYRLTGELNEAHDQTEAADGGAKTSSASARRLARMIGCDFHDGEIQRWKKFAGNLRDTQLNSILQACYGVLSDCDCNLGDGIVGAGIGRFLAEDLAKRLDFEYRDFNTLFKQQWDHSAITIADCAPAVSVACLALVCG